MEMKLGSSLVCCLSSLQTETQWAFWSSLSSLGTNLAEIRHMFKLSIKMRWAVPYDSPTISQTSWWFCLRSRELLLCFPVLCLSTVVQNAHSRRQTFVRPWSVCTNKKFCFGSLHYLRRLPVAFGWFLKQFLRLKQNLMQILYSLKSFIWVVKIIAVSLKRNLTRTHCTYFRKALRQACREVLFGHLESPAEKPDYMYRKECPQRLE